MNLNYLKVEQPIGTFYITSISAADLVKMVNVVPRSESNNGVQRDLSKHRVKEIANFCNESDSTFPTSIIVSVRDNDAIRIDEKKHVFIITDNKVIGSVIDGQHRLAGLLQSSEINKFELPVVFMFNLTLEEEAYIFSIINSKQQPVTSSLIFDLFGTSSARSPQRTVHEIARTLNMKEDSPFYNRLKMLGTKVDNQDKATLSQGTFATTLLTLICKPSEIKQRPLISGMQLKPFDGMPLRELYIKDKDESILKILYNCFTGLKNVFPEYWKDPHSNVLWKSTGYGGVIKSLNSLIKKGIEEGSLQISFFEECFRRFQSKLNEESIKLTSHDFPGGGEQQQRKISLMIKEANDVD